MRAPAGPAQRDREHQRGQHHRGPRTRRRRREPGQQAEHGGQRQDTRYRRHERAQVEIVERVDVRGQPAERVGPAQARQRARVEPREGGEDAPADGGQQAQHGVVVDQPLAVACARAQQRERADHGAGDEHPEARVDPGREQQPGHGGCRDEPARQREQPHRRQHREQQQPAAERESPRPRQQLRQPAAQLTHAAARRPGP
ncbi:MAG: hypothetical protein U5K43_14400 [Halofilum sp. (in: g-proteobacteria)]|nr:hypothetical protein [Halofilum sp. (in: g-proteobacteria)]